MGHYFKGRGPLKDLRNIRTFQGWLPSSDAVVFVSNHDDQRQNTNDTLTYKDPGDLYYIGEIFSLAYPYGYPKVMSSYRFDDDDQGPPSNGVHSGDACGVNWVCEHRWRGIANMVEFRNVTGTQFELSNWWDNGNNQIAFGRGDLGFVVINREGAAQLNEALQTGMPAGEYCDIINGNFDKTTATCDGPTITINNSGNANFNVQPIGASAIHVGARLDDNSGDNGGGNGGDITDPLWSNAYFRGTANTWGTTAMSFSDGLWRTTQTFGSNNPRFKVSRFQDWNEAYPNQDFQVTESGTYDITFNDQTQSISATKQAGNGNNNSGGQSVMISFKCNNGFTQAGQSVYAVGNTAELGNWNPDNAIKLDPTAYPTWEKAIAIDENTDVDWKCLKRSETNPSQSVQWQGGSNNTFTADANKQSSGTF